VNRARALLAALDGSHDAYREARAPLLAGGGEVPAFLERAARSRRERVALGAAMIRLHADEPALCERVAMLMRADPRVMPGVPAGGAWSPEARGERIAQLGADAGLRALELLTRSRGYRSYEELAALHAALRRLADPRSVASLRRELRGRRAREKERAAHTLAWLRVPEAFGDFVAELERRDNPGDVRESCAHALALLGDRRATPALLTAAGDREAPEPLRKLAVLAVGSLGDRAAAPALEALRADAGGELAAALAEVLATFG